MPFLFEQTKQIKIADTSSSLQTEVTETFPNAASSHLPNAFSQMEKSLSEPLTDVSASCHNVDALDDTNDSPNTVSMVGITFIANLMNVKLAILNFANCILYCSLVIKTLQESMCKRSLWKDEEYNVESPGKRI